MENIETRVLKTLKRSRTLTEIARSAGADIALVQKAVNELVGSGEIVRESGGRYRKAR